jgi:hypothetical protein
LDLLGAGGTVVLLGWIAGESSLFSLLFKNRDSDGNSSGRIRSGGSSTSPQLAYAQSTGSWLPVQSSTAAVAIHTALTRTGKIFYMAGSGWNVANRNGPYTARLLDPVTGVETNLPLSKDLFCVGENQLPNGNILLTGGTAMYENDINNCDGRWHGARYAFELDVATETLVEQDPMLTGRWYPTQVTLPNGRVLVVSGMDDFGAYNYLAELYDPITKSWSISYDPFTNNTYCVGHDSTCPGAGTPCFGGPNQGTAPWLSLYPVMFLMPSGLVYTSCPREELYLFDPSTNRWTRVGVSAFGQYRDYGTSILLPLQNSSSERGKVMVLGGSVTGTGPATAVVEIHDFNQGTSTNPNIRTVRPLNRGRKYPLPIILPDGKVVIFGGSSQANENPVFVPEMFDPENESQGWVNLPAATVPRVYHGTAVLLPDGSVWTAGSNPQVAVPELRIEIFRPSYFFSATARPTISGTPTVGGYGATITIPTPDAQNISRVSLVKTGCQTHHYDPDMRLIWLPITSRTTNTVTVSAPINVNIAPPGYYMIHVLDGSLVPSTARIIQIPGTGADTTPPAKVTGLTVTTAAGTAGTSQLNLAWTANTEPDLNHYNVYRGTVQGFSVTPGTTLPVAIPTTNSYMDTGRNPATTYYYRVAAVDNAGNIGTLSDERSGRTNSVDTTAPTVTINNPNNNAKVSAGNLTVSGTSQDNTGGSGINNVAVQVDSGPYVTATGTTNWSVVINIPTKGSHRVTARSQDNAGNFGFSKTINVKVQ